MANISKIDYKKGSWGDKYGVKDIARKITNDNNFIEDIKTGTPVSRRQIQTRFTKYGDTILSLKDAINLSQADKKRIVAMSEKMKNKLDFFYERLLWVKSGNKKYKFKNGKFIGAWYLSK